MLLPHVRIVLCLVGLNSLSVMLQVHTISGIFLGITLVERLLFGLTLARRDVLEVGGITRLRLLSNVLLTRLFLLFFVFIFIILIVAVLVSILASAGYELSLDFVFNLGLFLLHRVFRQESIRFHE